MRYNVNREEVKARETDRDYIQRMSRSRPMRGGIVAVWNVEASQFNPRRQVGRIPVAEFDLAKVSYILGAGKFQFRFVDAAGAHLGTAHLDIVRRIPAGDRRFKANK